MPRESGILLHVTSLPSVQGIGNLGPSAYRFVEFLRDTKQQLWQVLPLGPTGYGHSPYQSYSAFAGNPLLVSLEVLAEHGLLSDVELPAEDEFDDDNVEFEAVYATQDRLLRKAFERFATDGSTKDHRELASFNQQQSAWLEDYALFQALKTEHGGVAWPDWKVDVRTRQPEALSAARMRLQAHIDYEKFMQFQFHQQWNALKQFANASGISIVGDIPIFVAHDSADVWVNQTQFKLLPDGQPAAMAGVPPDYFSATGQLWGNPIYRWELMAADGYSWWVDRLRGALELFDRVRIDHFRGFESYWEVPGGATTAAGGRWVPGPGAALFEQAQLRLGYLPVIAEDLGVITKEVDALRERLGYPGMRVLQFAFGDDPQAIAYQPHSYPHDCVVYTGTHDNDTIVGWFRSQAGEGTTRTQESIDRERHHALRYMNSHGEEIHWDMIRLALASVANTAIFPMQDLLALGSEARMNQPGTSTGNWRWRFRWEMLTPSIQETLGQMTELYGREAEFAVSRSRIS